MTRIEELKEAMKAYREEWELTNPPPERGEVRKMDFLQFYLFLPVALLGPLVSAFRTAALLVETAAFQADPLLVMIEALLGTAFFELGAVVYQIIRLRRKAQEGDGTIPRVGSFWIIVGMIITIGAVTTSNFVEVLIAALEKAGTNFIPPAMVALLIGAFIGPGVAICSVIAGEVVGRFLLEWQGAVTAVDEVHKEALAKWNKSFVSSWSGKKGKAFLARYLGEEEKPAAELPPSVPTQRHPITHWMEVVKGFYREDPRGDLGALAEEHNVSFETLRRARKKLLDDDPQFFKVARGEYLVKEEGLEEEKVGGAEGIAQPIIRPTAEAELGVKLPDKYQPTGDATWPPDRHRTSR